MKNLQSLFFKQFCSHYNKDFAKTNWQKFGKAKGKVAFVCCETDFSVFMLEINSLYFQGEMFELSENALYSSHLFKIDISVLNFLKECAGLKTP